MPRPRRCGGTCVRSAPSRRIAPRSGATKPAIIISVVVLPDPDGPSSEKNSPGRISASTASTTRSSPYCLVRPISSSAPRAPSIPLPCGGKSVSLTCRSLQDPLVPVFADLGTVVRPPDDVVAEALRLGPRQLGFRVDQLWRGVRIGLLVHRDRLVLGQPARLHVGAEAVVDEFHAGLVLGRAPGDAIG